MELKVWVEGVELRVVCGLSINTSCQDVVIALAQAIGQTGRYVLISRLRGDEKQLVADDCPLQHLAQLGQLAPEVQFILRRTGPSLSDGKRKTKERRRPHIRPSEPSTFSLDPSTFSKGTKTNRTWSPFPRRSPESWASSGSVFESHNSQLSKEQVIRHILQQQRTLQDLEIQVEALEREMWASALGHEEEQEKLEELEQRQRQNEAELTHGAYWEDQFQAEVDREQDLLRRLRLLHSSVDAHTEQTRELQGRCDHLQRDLQLAGHSMSWQAETLRPLRQELHHRLQQGEDLEATLSQLQSELQAAQRTLQDRWQLMEELNKELRQCHLQQFIQQTGGSHGDHTDSPPFTDLYLSSATTLFPHANMALQMDSSGDY